MRVHPFVLLSVLALASGSAAAQAPLTTAVAPPEYRGVQTFVSGVFVTPMPNIPFSALVDISSMRVLPDGTTELRKTSNHIARDSQGRIYNERRQMVAAAYSAEPRLLSAHIYDPQTRLSIFWNPYSNVAQATTLNPARLEERKPFLIPVPGTTDLDLGQSTMSGQTVHGLRRTRELKALDAGTGKPLQVVDEYWYSDDLHMIMLGKHDDPRTGEQIVTVLDVDRKEPAATMFTVPSGYRTVDMTSDGPGIAQRPQPAVIR